MRWRVAGAVGAAVLGLVVVAGAFEALAQPALRQAQGSSVAAAANRAADQEAMGEAAAMERLAGIPATLVVVDPADGRVVHRFDPERAAERTPPCSTFKIPNALISLGAGAVTVEDNAIPRDREAVPAQEWWPAHWDEDQDLRSAIHYSVVWYFQELARRVGAETMQRRLDEIGYGNRDISGGLDRFWLSSSLAISADEQAAFLVRLVNGELPFDPAHVAYVHDALRLDADGEPGAAGSWALYGKTGACNLSEDAETWVGWLVGWVEGAGGDPAARRVYAFRVEADSYDELKRRRDVVRPVLVALGVLPAATDSN